MPRTSWGHNHHGDRRKARAKRDLRDKKIQKQERTDARKEKARQKRNRRWGIEGSELE